MKYDTDSDRQLFRRQFLEGVGKVLKEFPQVIDDRLQWIACGSVSWFSLMYASKIERMMPVELPTPFPADVLRKSEFYWTETAPDRRIKDVDAIQYFGENLNGKTVRIGNLDRAFRHRYDSGVCPKDSVRMDAVRSDFYFGDPVRCTIDGKGGLSIFTDAPEVNLAHKFVQAFDGRRGVRKRAMKDLAMMEPLQPLAQPVIFLEYLLDEGHPPNELFAHVRDGRVTQKRFEELPDAWVEFIDGTLMHPSGPGQYMFVPLIGYLDIPAMQALNYLSVLEHYANQGIPIKEMRRHLRECHENDRRPDYERLDTWEIS